jgi:hypothetical protein
MTSPNEHDIRGALTGWLPAPRTIQQIPGSEVSAELAALNVQQHGDLMGLVVRPSYQAGGADFAVYIDEVIQDTSSVSAQHTGATMLASVSGDFLESIATPPPRR